VKIQFLFVGHKEESSGYHNIFHAHVAPIIKHFLPSDEVIFYPEIRDGYTTITLGRAVADIFIHHGISDKNWRDAKNMDGAKYVFVPGPAWVEKLTGQGMDEKRIRIVGYPLLDPIFERSIPGDSNIVLWAPTHANSPTTYPHLRDPLMESCKKLGLEFIESPHPHHGVSGDSTQEIIARSAVVVADSGSSIYEAWAMGVPVVIPDYAIKRGMKDIDVAKEWPGSFESIIYSEKIGHHVYREEDLTATIQLAISEGVTQKARDFMDGIFPVNLRGNSGLLAANTIREIAEDRK